MANAAPFKVRDVVMVKPGGRLMTVVRVDADRGTATCEWRGPKGGIHTERHAMDDLIKPSPRRGPMRPVFVALALVTMAIAGLARAAERVPPTDYPDSVQVQDYLASLPKAGSRVSIYGYPVCPDGNECRLLAAPKHVYPHLLFDMGSLEGADRQRIMHCLDPDLTTPCSAVIYGARKGSEVKAARIWWRSLE